MTENFLTRMIDEKTELEERVTKLNTFIDSNMFKKLDKENQKLLKKQQAYMLGYLNTLTQRIILNQ